MEKKNNIKEYQKGDFIIEWEAKKCIHSGICVQKLPKVYKPNEKPWINAESASVEELKAQIDLCPSGALSYYIKGQKEKKVNAPATQVMIKPNGPAILKGSFTITHANGSVEEIEKMAAICRCGASSKKPFCDGSHATIGFKG